MWVKQKNIRKPRLDSDHINKYKESFTLATIHKTKKFRTMKE